MTTNELKSIISHILFSEQVYGLTVFTCLKEETNLRLKKLQITDTLKTSIRSLLESVATSMFLAEETELDSAENIADNRKVLYEIAQTELYTPFDYLNDYQHITDTYSESDQKNLVGYFFRVNRNDDAIWFFQAVYPMSVMDRSKMLYAILSKGETYTTLKKEIVRIDQRLDIAIIGNSIITSKIELLQRHFGFEEYVRSEAYNTVCEIEALNLLSDTEKFLDFINKAKLTNAKKLMKVKNSPVLKMDKVDLFRRLKRHPRYQDKFKYAGDTIVIKTQKDVNEFIKMLNDDIVRSDLTDQEYDSPSKQPLEPIGRVQ